MKNAITINLRPNSQWYEQFTYPAGETQVRFFGTTWEAAKMAEYVTIIARIKSAQDIIVLAHLNNALQASVQYRKLVLPYLPYSRADRRFKLGDCCGLQVFGQLIGSMNFDEVVTLDAHNHDKATLHVPFLLDRPADELIQRAIADFARKHNSSRITVLFPDKGARERYVIPPAIACNTGHIDIDVLHCNKKRDPIGGAFEGFDVPGIPPDYPAIIVDDICDGGGTFVGIAQKAHGIRLGLYVTHGIFSKGHELIGSYFDQIYTTNTIEQAPEAPVIVFDAMPLLLK